MVSARTFIGLLLIPVVLAAGLGYFFYKEGKNIAGSAFATVPPLLKAGQNFFYVTREGPITFTAAQGETLVAGFSKGERLIFVTNKGIVEFEGGFKQITSFDDVEKVHSADVAESEKETIVDAQVTLKDGKTAQIITRINEQGIAYETTVIPLYKVSKSLQTISYNPATRTLTFATSDGDIIQFTEINGRKVVKEWSEERIAAIVVDPAQSENIPTVDKGAETSLTAKRIGESSSAEVLFKVLPKQTVEIYSMPSEKQQTLQETLTKGTLRAVARNPTKNPLVFRALINAPTDKFTNVAGSAKERNEQVPVQYDFDEWLEKKRKELEIQPKEPLEPERPGGQTTDSGDTIAPFEPLQPAEPSETEQPPCEPKLDPDELYKRLSIKMPEVFPDRETFDKYVSVKGPCGQLLFKIPCEVYYGWKSPGDYIAGMLEHGLGIPPWVTKAGLAAGLFTAGEEVPIPLCKTVNLKVGFSMTEVDGKKEREASIGLSIDF